MKILSPVELIAKMRDETDLAFKSFDHSCCTLSIHFLHLKMICDGK